MHDIVVLCWFHQSCAPMEAHTEVLSGMRNYLIKTLKKFKLNTPALVEAVS